MVLILILFAALFHTVFAVSVLTLAICGRLFRAEKATLGRAAAVQGILLVLTGPLLLWSNRISDANVVGPVMLLGVQFLATWLLIRWLLCTGGGKAALITFSWLVASSIPSLALASLFRATVVEAFVVPTGAMAPTVYGRHVDKTCGQCRYGFAVGASFRQEDPGATALATCTNCEAPVEVLPSDQTISGDRIWVSKLDSPSRWDLVVFPPPVDTSTMYVKRLVGLPGETIEIRGGDLYAGGRRLRKPPGTLNELWLPVHDTDFVPQEPASEEKPRWVPSGEPSRWTWQPGQGWRFQGSPRQRGELTFSQPVTDRLAYNAEFGYAGRAFDARSESNGVLVPDLEVVCQVTRTAGSGVWGFLWDYRADRLTASIEADGTVTLVHSAREPGQGDTGSQDQGHIQGRLAAPPSGTEVRFAVRDGQAYVMQDRQLIAVLTLPDRAGRSCQRGRRTADHQADRGRRGVAVEPDPAVSRRVLSGRGAARSLRPVGHLQSDHPGRRSVPGAGRQQPSEPRCAVLRPDYDRLRQGRRALHLLAAIPRSHLCLACRPGGPVEETGVAQITCGALRRAVGADTPAGRAAAGSGQVPRPRCSKIG